MNKVKEVIERFRKKFYIKEDTDTFAGNVAAPVIEAFLTQELTQALTNQKNQILELEEMREEKIKPNLVIQDGKLTRDLAVRNDLRKSLKKAIEGI